MRIVQSTFCILCLTLLTACRQTPPSEPAVVTPPPPEPVSQETRERLQKRAPDALIGRIVAVLPEERLAAVAEMDTQKLRRGDIILFVGAEDVELGPGTIVQILTNAAHVRYEQPREGRRIPAVGDLAVWFPRR